MVHRVLAGLVAGGAVVTWRYFTNSDCIRVWRWYPVVGPAEIARLVGPCARVVALAAPLAVRASVGPVVPSVPAYAPFGPVLGPAPAYAPAHPYAVAYASPSAADVVIPTLAPISASPAARTPAPQPVPEPGAVVAFLVGVLGVLVGRRACP